MAFRHLRKSFSEAKRDELSPQAFPHEVAGYRTLKVDDSHADDDIIVYTDLMTMDDGIQYIVTSNVVESDAERERDPSLKQFAGSDLIAIEPTALTTQYGKYYDGRLVEHAARFHRPAMVVGAPRNHDRYVSFDRQMNDVLAIYAFNAAWYGYDQTHATAQGISRGGMGSILLQLFARRYGINIVHTDSMEPCIPRLQDALMLGTHLPAFMKSEFGAARELELNRNEALRLHDTIDRDIYQQIKETAVIVNSNIARKVERDSHKDAAVDITIQTGSVMACLPVWQKSFAKYPNARFNLVDGGGHVSVVGKPFLRAAAQREEARSAVLHADPAHRKVGGRAFRQLLDDYASQHPAAA